MLTAGRGAPLGVGLAVLAVSGTAAPRTVEAQAPVTPPAIGQVHQHIQSISPLSGPHGTEVSIRIDGLKPNQNYQIAFGEMEGCGYQVCEPVRSGASGSLVAAVEVPEWAHTHHYEVVMILAEDFVPVAVSDPFHVVDSDGLVRRQGVIGAAWPGCPSLEGEGNVTYALLGPKARSLLASEGHEMIIEGRVVEGRCTHQYAIEVESMELVREGG